ncbi:bifunctional phosphatase PAP2/diacylglycerol kinase family protein [Kitasatospora kazusensis]|uniref:Bifunctional phosphatase PAP2/diacylglycerol kinase family protein n=1 Tax=Kitasatospora kazusensis TaxID=407974 RepID=A0ABP5LZE3_9ACTN
MGRITELDSRLFARVARARLRGVDVWLPRLSRSANHGVLWTASAGLLAASGDRTARRAALRGVGSLLLASAAANLVAKSVTRRQRPLLNDVPLVRRLARQPFTTSFPSGHSASAAAFATGLALESPTLGAIAAPVAGAVMASRVFVGAHYPSDVIAGATLGASMAALTLRWWPRRADSPASAARPGVAVPALPRGEGLSVVVNGRSGSQLLPGFDATPDGVVAELRELLPAADIRVCGHGDDLAKVMAEAAEGCRALGVCGGDGTVNLAASVASERGLPLAVFPGGTLNHFAVDLGTHSLRSTAEAVEAGSGAAVDVGRVSIAGDNHLFLNTFSLGVYPELVLMREKLEKHLGKWPALAVALVCVLATAEPVQLEVAGEPREVWLLFAGNGSYDPPGFAPSHRSALDEGKLDIRVVDGSHPFARTRLVAAFLSGTLSRSRVYRSARLSALDLTRLHDVTHMSLDGETVEAPDRLRLSNAARGLTVYRPEHPAVP